MWSHKNKTDDFKLTFAEIENIAGVPIDHSFLTFKKELLQYGFKVVKISMKEQTVDFEKVNLKSSVLFLLIHFHKGLYLLIIIIHLLSKTIYDILYHQSDLLHLPQHFPCIKYFLIFSIPSASIWYWSAIVPFSKWMTSVQHSIISSKSCVIT